MLQAIQVGYAAGSSWLTRRLDIELRPGEVAAVVGPNGAGKSTALRLLAGLLRPAEGSILVDGRPIGSIDRAELARRVSYVPQDPPQDVAFTVWECVSMGRFCHRRRFQPEGAEDRRAVGEALAAMDCAHLAGRLLNELSSGEMQRVVLARSLATEAQHLLLDEPTANLDVEHSLAILDLVQKMAANGRSVLLALHDLNSVLRATTSVYVLARGTIYTAGPPGEVLTTETIQNVFSVKAERLGDDPSGAFRFERLLDSA